MCNIYSVAYSPILYSEACCISCQIMSVCCGLSWSVFFGGVFIRLERLNIECNVGFFSTLTTPSFFNLYLLKEVSLRGSLSFPGMPWSHLDSYTHTHTPGSCPVKPRSDLLATNLKGNSEVVMREGRLSLPTQIWGFHQWPPGHKLVSPTVRSPLP